MRAYTKLNLDLLSGSSVLMTVMLDAGKVYQFSLQLCMLRIAKLYTFEMEFAERAKLPRWKGNIIRGAIGRHLIEKFCLYNRDCSSCSLLFRCPYGYLYEVKSKGIVLRNIEGFTKPYVIKPPVTEETDFSEGDSFTFSIVLFGDSTRFEKQVLSAVIEMGRKGIGTREKRGRLELKRAYVENPFRREKSILYEGDLYETKTWINTRDISKRIGSTFMLRFLTPFRLVKDRELLKDLEFHQVFPFMLRKYSSIMQQYVGSIDVDARRAVEESIRVKLIGSRIKELNFKYKGEDQTFLIGDLIYSGNASAHLRKPLLFCQLSHIGKRSSFGHGWYELISVL
ncbi:MAG: CRISPR system precrRNA processing endoribonuclease RAMP protein Cas6 [Candidatus Methanodesulfokora sp.]|jgi:hypothetical protein|nr:MAG: hypothetical protein C0200_02085 [Candidatus Korarchaeota archaeon]